MKKNTLVLILIAFFAFSFSSKASFVLAIYRVASNSKVTINANINGTVVGPVEKNTILWHTIETLGEMKLEGKATGLRPERILITSVDKDTQYVRIEALGVSYVTITSVSKEKMYKDLSKKEEKFIEKSSAESKANPYKSGNKSYDGGPQSSYFKFGTGFLLSHEGYVITNYHVAYKANEILVKGLNGDRESSSLAQIILLDEDNDLAILKLTTPIELDTVPYVFQSEMASLGERVYVLGYPLKTTMGEDIKLVDGLISSRSGFESNVNSYQISAPLQPGNSGAPLFGDKGNVLGVVNAKHRGAENANYAIKARYVFLLAANAEKPIFINTNNKLINKSFVDQVNTLQKFIYIIEVK